jgi:hypothetical protein
LLNLIFVFKLVLSIHSGAGQSKGSSLALGRVYVDFQRVCFLVNCRSHSMVVIQASLWWKETFPVVVVEAGVSGFGEEPSSWGPWW